MNRGTLKTGNGPVGKRFFQTNAAASVAARKNPGPLLVESAENGSGVSRPEHRKSPAHSPIGKATILAAGVLNGTGVRYRIKYGLPGIPEVWAWRVGQYKFPKFIQRR